MDDLTILAIGDIHYKVSNLSESYVLSNKIIALVKERKPRYVVFHGDLHDDFERIHSSVLTAIQDLVYEVSKITRTIVLIGNHDLINNSIFLEPKHPFNGMKGWPNVVVIDDVRKMTVTQGEFILCPYIPPGRFKEALNRVPSWENARAIFCHQEFKNANLGGIPSIVGDEWELNLPMIISGHIHDYGRVQPNILYIGTPRAQAFGESLDKTVSLFTFDDKSFFEERIDLGMPKKISYELSVEDARKFQPIENSVCRIYLTSSLGEILAFKKTKEYKELEKIAKIIPKPNDVETKIVKKGRKNYLDIVKQECEKAGPGVVAAFQEIINEA